RSRINDQAARILSAVTLWLSPALVVAQLDKTDKPFVIQPLAHTYSIAARDPEAGQLGAAAQSRRFSVFFPSSWICTDTRGGLCSTLLATTATPADLLPWG